MVITKIHRWLNGESTVVEWSVDLTRWTMSNGRYVIQCDGLDQILNILFTDQTYFSQIGEIINL
jgi:hypothetical protein